MCGIVGAVGDSEAATTLYKALERLEYRGYDSSGIVVEHEGDFHRRRTVGKLKSLGALLDAEPLTGAIGIGHTRWATHGGISEANAHPIMTSDAGIAVVHNGIIENYRHLKDELQTAGYVFVSDTDTEVLCHLFAQALTLHKTFAEATAAVIDRIEGAYAFAVMASTHIGQVAIARKSSPLAIGLGDKTNYIGSDAIAMDAITRQVIFLKDGDYGVVMADDIELYDVKGNPAQREIVTVDASPGLISRDGYAHFMEKEIHEQPEAIAHSLAGMLDDKGAFITPIAEAKTLKGISLLAAGTSHNAALIGKYWFESLADLPAAAEIASEFRYRNPSMRNTSLALGISQSGESLDTLMALRHAAEHEVATLGIVNVPQSSIAREVDFTVLTRAGPEIAVASTKAFTAQLTVLLALAAGVGRDRGVLDKAGQMRVKSALESLPRLVGEALSCFDSLQPVIEKVASAHSCLFLGRGLLYPLALEGALKLKELSYVHAEGYASGEMKHGPIALIEEGLPVIALLTDDEHLPKAVSNLAEAHARGAAVIAIATKSATASLSDIGDVITIPDCDSLVAPILLSIPAQILSYLVALHKGTDIDQPRNLAKSVTVE